jgi:Flp pilus assembly protein TadG
MFLRRGDDAGQAVLEVALFAPFMLVLLMAAIDLGRLSQFDTVLAASARAGAQYGSLNLVNAANTAGMTSAATNEAQGSTAFTVTSSNFCQCYGSTGTVTCTSTACATTHRMLFVKVSVSATFVPLFHYFPGMTGLKPLRMETMQVGQ